MNASTRSTATIDPREAAHFGALADDWWNPKGASAVLHRMNPPRLAYVRETIDRHWKLDRTALKPLSGRRSLDVGCGAGLLSEPLARLGAAVTGIDAAPENIAAAKAHAEAMGLSINYRATDVAHFKDGGFDLITSMEVIEHVSDVGAFVRALARLLAPGGIMILSTPNRTERSRLALITLGEGLGLVPRHTHDWSKFVTPEELTAMLEEAGLAVIDRRGLGLSMARGFVLSDDLSLDYLLAAVPSGTGAATG